MDTSWPDSQGGRVSNLDDLLVSDHRHFGKNLADAKPSRAEPDHRHR